MTRSISDAEFKLFLIICCVIFMLESDDEPVRVVIVEEVVETEMPKPELKSYTASFEITGFDHIYTGTPDSLTYLGVQEFEVPHTYTPWDGMPVTGWPPSHTAFKFIRHGGEKCRLEVAAVGEKRWVSRPVVDEVRTALIQCGQGDEMKNTFMSATVTEYEDFSAEIKITPRSLHF